MTSDESETSQSIGRSATDRPDGVASRNRNVETIDQIFRATGGPAEFIDGLWFENAPFDVLEVGFGWGIALLQLAWRFHGRGIHFHGVDIEPKIELSTPERVVMFACEQGIVPEAQASELNPPRFSFYDATTLEFDDECMDFVFSAVTIRFMADKIAFIQEVARVLRPNGQALLHIGESHWSYPHSRVTDAPLLTPFTSRLILKHGDELIPLPAYFRLFENDRFSFRFTEQSRCILIMSKHKSGRLDLGLALNDGLTMSGRSVPLVNRKGEVRGGMRSVYDVSDAAYREAVRRGLIPRGGGELGSTSK